MSESMQLESETVLQNTVQSVNIYTKFNTYIVGLGDLVTEE